MKNKLLVFTIFFFAHGNIFAQNFKEIYDFEVGDIFQYKQTDYSGESGYNWNIVTTEKYEIFSKEIIGDTIKYSILGKRLEHTYDINYTNGSKTNNKYVFSDINKTLVFVDSTENILNSSIGNLEIIHSPIDEVFLTRVLVDTSNGLRKKIFGGDKYAYNSNLFKYSSDTNVLDTIHHNDYDVFSSRYKLSYSKNLGLVEEDYWGFEYGYFITLEGYVKGTDTTGIISADNSFTNIPETPQSNIKIYPNPAGDYLFYRNPENHTFNEIVIYDLLGRKVIHSIFIERLNISSLNKGIYILKIIESETSEITMKLLKE